jgi:hypothetical protein
VLITGSDGRVSTDLPAGTYTIIPTKADLVFNPVSLQVTVPPGTNITFTAAPSFTISGRVFEGDTGLSNVTVSADAYSAVTDATGAYTITGVAASTYFVFPARAGYRFSPSQEVTVGPNATNVDFFVSNRVFAVSGRVLEGTNGLGGVTFQEYPSLITDTNGFFRLADLVPDTYTFTPRKVGSTFAFTPSTHTVVVSMQDVTNVTFQAGTVLSALTLMPSGQAQFSVMGPVRTNCIEASTNLQDWEIIFTNSTVPFQFSDPNASNFPARYYRVIPQP